MTSQFLEQERKKLKKEWEALEEPKLTWEEFKRKKQKKTFKQLIVNEKTPNKDEHEDKRGVVWMGEIPLGKENEMRYPTEEEVEISLYVLENLPEEEYDKMTEEEYNEFENKAKRIIRKRLENEL